MGMDIHGKRGAKVLVTKKSAHNGYDSDEQKVAELLNIGEIYSIQDIEVSNFSTEVYLEGFSSSFNSVMFIDYVYSPQEKDFQEPESPKETNVEAYEFALRKWRADNAEQIEARAMFKEGVIKLAESEIIVGNIRAYGKNVNGCVRHKKDIMLSYTVEGNKTIYDLFLDRDQAAFLYEEMGKWLNYKYDE